MSSFIVPEAIIGAAVMSLLLTLSLLVVKLATAEQQRQLLARAESSLGVADWLEGGSCVGDVEGCRREAISARATVLGQPFENDACGVVERSGGDGYTMDDVTDGFTFGVLHTCESEGEILAPVGAKRALVMRLSSALLVFLFFVCFCAVKAATLWSRSASAF